MRAAVGALLVALAVVVGVLVTHVGAPGFDAGLVHDARSLRDGTAGAALRFVSRVGYATWLMPIATVAAVVVGVWRGRAGDAVLVVLAPAIAVVLNAQVLKPAFSRARPVDRIDALGPSLSMPSGHASTTAAFAMALVLAVPPGRVRVAVACIAGGFSLATGLSRVALGAHFPSDVLAGWLEGAGIALLLAAAIELVRSRAARPAQ